jgi:hypothetical protein
LKFDDATDAMLGVDNIITDVEGQRLGSHSFKPFRGPLTRKERCVANIAAGGGTAKVGPNL